MTPSNLPNLRQCFACYLDQDYDLHVNTWQESIALFAEEMDGESVRNVIAELDTLLASQHEVPNIGLFLLKMGCYYDPNSDGSKYEDWLVELRSEIAMHTYSRDSDE